MAASTTARRKPRLSRQERSAMLEALAGQLKEFAASLDDEERDAHAARFDHYSPLNALLIVMQRPDATVVRGFDAWKLAGRQVRRDETAIRIRKVIGRDDVTADDGKVTREGWRSCIWLSVFDISQTDPIGATAADDETEAAA